MDYMWWSTGVLGLIIICCANWLIKKQNKFWKDRKIEHLNFELIKPIRELLFPINGSVVDQLDAIYKKLDGQKMGGYYQLLHPVLMIRDPGLINQILVKDFSYFVDRNHHSENEKNLFCLTLGHLVGDKWSTARHKLTPAFSMGKLKMMIPCMEECGQEMIDYLENKDERVIDTQEVMSKYIINVTGKIVFGIQVNTFDENDSESIHFVNTVRKLLMPSFINILKAPFSLLPPRVFKLNYLDNDVNTLIRNLVKDCLRFRKDQKDKRNDFIDLVIEEMKKEEAAIDSHKNSDYNTNQVDVQDEPKYSESTEQMNNTNNYKNPRNKEKTFTEEFIGAQALVFLSVGTSTTSLGLSYLLYELSLNQNIQEHLRNEINAIIKTEGINYENINNMQYLDLCVRECMRKHPVIPSLNRVCTKRYNIPGTDITIDKGQMISVPVYSIHHDTQNYTDPEVFNPNRFKNVKPMQSNIYMPFGLGPRSCIAMRLAVLEIKIVVIKLLSNYKLSMNKKTKRPIQFKKFAFFSEPDGGIWVNIEKLGN